MSQGYGRGWPPSPGWPPPPQQPPPPTGQDPRGWAGGQPEPAGYPTKFCHACGSVIDARAEICPRCGVRQPGAVVGGGKDRALSVLLAILLGAFGVHRFYLGQVAWGIIYLLFFWTGIPGLLAWFEAIYFLTRSNEDWARDHGGPVQTPNPLAIGCLWILVLLPLLAIVGVFFLISVGGQVNTILSQIESVLETPGFAE